MTDYYVEAKQDLDRIRKLFQRLHFKKEKEIAVRRVGKRLAASEIKEMREKLINSLNSHFEEEIQRSIRHMEETIAPYTRFVRSEQVKNQEAKNKLEEVIQELSQVEKIIKELPGSV